MNIGPSRVARIVYLSSGADVPFEPDMTTRAVSLARDFELAKQFVVKRGDDHLFGHELMTLQVENSFVEFDQQIRRFSLRLQTQLLEQYQVQYPADWLEAAKERWAPAWLRRRWPVRYTKVIRSIEAVYPKMLIPNEKHFVVVSERKDGGSKNYI